MRKLFYEIILLLLITSMVLGSFNTQSVKANQVVLSVGYPSQVPAVNILSPQNKTYTNSSVPLTFTIDQSATWISYCLNGQPNVTITGNTTLPAMPDGSQNLIVYYNISRETEASSRSFTIDTAAPTGSIALSDGKTMSKDAAVILSLSAFDATSGVAKMRFFNFAWDPWEEYATTKSWVFAAGEGYKTVYAQFMDYAGLISGPYRLTIYVGANEPPDPSQEPEELPVYQDDGTINPPPEEPQETPLPSANVEGTETPTGQVNEQTSPNPTQTTSTFPQLTAMELAIIALFAIVILAITSVYFTKRVRKPTVRL